MKKWLPTTFILSIALLSGIAEARIFRPDHVKNELLIKFLSNTDKSTKNKTHSLLRAEVVNEFERLGWQLVKVPEGMSIGEAITYYRSSGNVEHVQPNFFYSLNAIPNDPDFDHAGMYGLSKINAPAAWDLSTGSEDVVIANIDTGMRYTHEDLAGNMWRNTGEIPNNGIDDDGNGFIDDYYGWDFRYNDSDPLDEHGHGTHVGGTLGAQGNNGIGIVGVNWRVSIMAIKIFSASGGDTTSDMLIAAYDYVRMMKDRGVNIRVTNNSYGGCNEACGYDQATKDALEALGEANILNVFASGNGGINIDVSPHYPASYDLPSILSVGASDASDSRFFNYGPLSVDLAAPGIGIRSTTRTSDSSYGPLTGTSMAAPHVAGAAALLAAYRPELSAASLKATLMNTVDVLPQWEGFVLSGGRLNVARALAEPTECNIELSQEKVSSRTKGGYFSINVEAPPNCDYSVKSSANWLIVESNRVDSGNSLMRFRVRFNPSPARNGTIVIGDRTLTVSQSRAINF